MHYFRENAYRLYNVDANRQRWIILDGDNTLVSFRVKGQVYHWTSEEIKFVWDGKWKLVEKVRSTYGHPFQIMQNNFLVPTRK